MPPMPKPESKTSDVRKRRVLSDFGGSANSSGGNPNSGDKSDGDASTPAGSNNEDVGKGGEAKEEKGMVKLASAGSNNEDVGNAGKSKGKMGTQMLWNAGKAKEKSGIGKLEIKLLINRQSKEPK
jgi:hypothetical protein